jgi:O-antigen/teichoic acid export membrane protein
MSLVKKLVKQSSHYFLGEFLSVLSGFISFPIFTRIFTKEEYGILSLVTITLTLANTLISGGLRPAIIRFYPQAKKDGTRHLKLLYSTMILTVTAFGIIGIVMMIALSQIGIFDFMHSATKDILSFASILILFRVASATIRSFLQCEDATILFNFTYVAEKYLGLVFALIFILKLQMGVGGLFVGLIVGEGIIFLVLVYRVINYLKADFFKFSKDVLVENVSYGFPLLASNLAGFLNNSGSRYLIEYFMNTAAVAIYSVSFNLALYIQNLFVFTLNKALIPMVMNLWVDRGKDETSAFLTKFINYYFMVGIPIIFGLTALGENFLVFIASEKYAESSKILFWIISALILGGGYFPLLAGLYLEKKTKIVAVTLMLSAVVNMGMSAVLIPIWGLAGAALGALLGYAAYIVYGYYRSYVFLNVRIDYLSIFRFTIFSLIMFLAIQSVDDYFHGTIIIFLVEILIGILVYGILIILFDPEIKSFLSRFIIPKIKTIYSERFQR